MKHKDISFETMTFAKILEADADLKALRQEFAKKSAKERRLAADWAYHSEAAVGMFNRVLARAGQEELPESSWPAGVESLAIDPLYSPALLTVGSMEYQLGRQEEAMKLFITLTTLPENENDLNEIIDKAGDFLIDEGDFKRAMDLYMAAEQAFPDVAVYPNGSAYCLSKLGHFEEAVEKARHVDRMEPNNYIYLNDLGWSLVEAGHFEEAEKILKCSIALAPDDYKFPHNNLNELYKRKANQRS